MSKRWATKSDTRAELHESPFSRNAIGAIFLVILLAWFASPFILGWLIGGLQDQAHFGESFGALDALFSGLAFAGVIYTIFLQRKELRFQRLELELAREELARTASATEESYRQTTKALSASTFFHVMSIFDDLRPQWHKVYDLPDDFLTWDEEQLKLADHVGTELQRVAYLSLSGFIEAEYILEAYGKVFVQSWDKLDSYIRAYRESCGEPSHIEEGGYQRKHFELFVRKCRK